MRESSSTALSLAFVCPKCGALGHNIAWDDGTLRWCQQCRSPEDKSDAEFWAESDPPLHAVLHVLRAYESPNYSIPDYDDAFDPIIQRFRKALVESGYLCAVEALTHEWANEELVNLLIAIGAAPSKKEAMILRSSAIVTALKGNHLREVIRSDDPDIDPNPPEGVKNQDNSELEKLEQEIPSYEPGNADWISNKVTAKILGFSTARTLNNRRHKGHKKFKLGTEQYGLHDKGLFWRKLGKDHAIYYSPLMKEHVGHLVGIFPKLDSERLKNLP